ncbi:MAG: LysE family translocator [Deltaproteobacteria bacterium]|nr:LysE family translocator [Deltaproteobacteria bacterium]
MGIVLGLYAGIAPGPLLALTISETLRHDMTAGMKVALAPIVTDLPIIILTVFVLSRFSGFHGVLGVISLGGGCFLLYLAYGCLRTRGLDMDVGRERTGPLAKGILVNALSPHPYLFWFSVGAPIIIQAGQQGLAGPLAFVGGFYVLLVGSKITLAALTGRFKSFLSGRAYRFIMRLLGVMLVVLAAALFREGLRLLEIL